MGLEAGAPWVLVKWFLPVLVHLFVLPKLPVPHAPVALGDAAKNRPQASRRRSLPGALWLELATPGIPRQAADKSCFSP